MKLSPRSGSPKATGFLVVVLVILWVLIGRDIDPSSVSRQYLDSQAISLILLLALVTGCSLVLGYRMDRARFRWMGGLRRRFSQAQHRPQSAAAEEIGSGSVAIQVELIGGPERMPVRRAIVDALSAEGPILVVGRGLGTARSLGIGPRQLERTERWDGPVSDEAIHGWMMAQDEPFTVLLLGAQSLKSWVLGERAETRLCRLLAALPAARAAGVLRIIEPLPIENVTQEFQDGLLVVNDQHTSRRMHGSLYGDRWNERVPGKDVQKDVQMVAQLFNSKDSREVQTVE